MDWVRDCGHYELPTEEFVVPLFSFYLIISGLRFASVPYLRDGQRVVGRGICHGGHFTT